MGRVADTTTRFASGARASTTSATSTSSCRATSSSCSPGSRARASRRSRSTPSTPRASAATSSRCRPTPGSSSGQMDKPDVDFIEGLSPAISIDQKSASTQPAFDRRHHHRDLRLPAPALRRASASRTARTAGGSSPARRRSRSSTACCSSRRAPGSRCWRRWCGAARVSTRGCSRSSPRRASPGPGSTASSSSWAGERRAAGPLREPHHRGRRRPPGAPAGHRAPAHRLARDRAPPRRRRRRGRDRAPGRTSAATSRRSRSRSTSRARTAGVSFDELAPRNFSFNSPYGACERCDGLGTRFEVDPELVVPDDDLCLARRRDRAVVGVPQPLLRARARLGRRGVRLLHRHAVEEAEEEGQEGRPLRHRQDVGEGVVPQPLRPAALVHHAVRRRDPVARAPAHRVRERPRPRADRGLHARGAVPGVRRRAPAAGVARGHGRRQEHLRGRRAVDPQGVGVPRVARAVRARPDDRGAGARRRSTSGCGSCSTSASTTSASTGRRPRLAGGEAQRIRLASQIGSGLVGVLYVLDEPSIGLHQRDNQRLIDTHGPPARPRQHRHRRRARRRDDPRRRPHRRHRAGRGRARRRDRRRGHARRSAGRAALDHRPVPLGEALDPGPRDAAGAGRRVAHGARRARAQPAAHRRRLPARLLRRGHRRERQRQEHARQRHPLPGADAEDLPVEERARPAQDDRGHRAHRQGHQHRPVADRSHAALEPGHLHRRLRQGAHAVRVHARRRRCAATCPGGSRST